MENFESFSVDEKLSREDGHGREENSFFNFWRNRENASKILFFMTVMAILVMVLILMTFPSSSSSTSQTHHNWNESTGKSNRSHYCRYAGFSNYFTKNVNLNFGLKR